MNNLLEGIVTWSVGFGKTRSKMIIYSFPVLIQMSTLMRLVFTLRIGISLTSDPVDSMISRRLIAQTFKLQLVGTPLIRVETDISLNFAVLAFMSEIFLVIHKQRN